MFNKDINIIDNFLDEKDFNFIESNINDNSFLWSYSDTANENSKENTFYFVNHLYFNNNYMSSLSQEIILKIFNSLSKHLNKKDFLISAAKVNLFLKKDYKQQYGFHKDLNDTKNYKTLIYYINDNNGGTMFKDNSFISQRKNRALLFDNDKLHQSIGQTNTNKRLVININYKEE